MINNRYIPLKFLGSGRSRVFLCQDLYYYNRNVVLKILSPEAPDYELKRFKSEFEILESVSHPAIIKVFEQSEILEIDENYEKEFGIRRGSLFIAMEYFEGSTLLDFSDEFNEDLITEILTKTSSVLYYLHQSNYIYLDLKPDNLLIKEHEDEIEIRLIDFGLCRENKTPEFEHTGGSVHYLAPEIIRGEIYDHRVDLYALGMMMYRLAYGEFPFSSENEIDIYREHVELEFSFPAGNLSAKLSMAIRKLLAKNPLERYHSALQMFHDLDYHVISKAKYNWLPAEKLFNRESLTSAVRNYIRGNIAEESILVVRGGSGSGKSALLNILNRDIENTILLKEANIGRKTDPVKALVSELYYNKNVYTKLSPELIQELSSFIKTAVEPDIEEVKSLLSRIASSIDGALLIDDFNTFDKINRELLSDFVKFLRIRDLKVVISENVEFKQYSDDLPNIRILNVTNMLNDEVKQFIEETFATFFPKEHLYEIFIQNQNRYPSYCIKLFSSLIVEDIIQFTSSGPYIVRNATKLGKILLKGNEIFNERLALLTESKRDILSVIALINADLDLTKLNYFFRMDYSELESLIQQFSALGFVNYSQENSTVKFVSKSVKDLILRKQPAIRSLHLKIAEIMADQKSEFQPALIAEHFSKAGNDLDALEYFELELKRTKRLAAFSYQIDITKKILELRISENKHTEASLTLSKLYFKMADYSQALENVLSLNLSKLSDEQKLRYHWIVGNCRIKLGFPSDGIKVINNNRSEIEKIIPTAEIDLALANAYFDLEQIDESEKICRNIIKNSGDDFFNSGGAFNLLGLISFYKSNDLKQARNYFEKAVGKYREGNLTSKAAGMEVNLGNIYNMIGKGDSAVAHWNNAGNINKNLGNYEQQAKLQLSFGIYHFENSDFENAIEKYEESLQIFSRLGDRNGEGLAHINLAEVHLANSEFKNAEMSINKAKGLFRITNNTEEFIEALYLSILISARTGNRENAYRDLQIYGDNVERSDNQRHQANYKYLLNLLSLEFDKKTFEEQALLKNIKYFTENNEMSRFSENLFLLVRIYVQFGDNKEALDLLQNESLHKYCSEHKFAAAEYYVLKSLIYHKTKEKDTGKTFNYAEKAFGILQEQNVSLLTLEAVFLLANLYFERGHEKLTEEYLFFAKSLIEHFDSKLDSTDTKNNFRQKKQIADIIRYLENAGYTPNYE
ncbi:MAG: hypothetical protein SCALA702_36520 [Melioribacteraceae bacterium]|nr:MAG: hypothetical protein SCALA702_36520 [Melioribacteraceae bacterium]